MFRTIINVLLHTDVACMTSIIMLSYVVDMHFPLLVINVCNLHLVLKKVRI